MLKHLRDRVGGIDRPSVDNVFIKRSLKHEDVSLKTLEKGYEKISCDRAKRPTPLFLPSESLY
jgi:hypothetical protein